MIVVTTYQCEVCGGTYGSYEAAELCESRPSPEGLWPIGTITAGEPGDLYDEKLAFALAKSTVRGHYIYAAMWACRDTMYGDSLGEQICGGEYAWMPKEFKAEWIKRPPMKRLLKWMKSAGIKAYVNIGGKPVELSE